MPPSHEDEEFDDDGEDIYDDGGLGGSGYPEEDLYDDGMGGGEEDGYGEELYDDPSEVAEEQARKQQRAGGFAPPPPSSPPRSPSPIIDDENEDIYDIADINEEVPPPLPQSLPPKNSMVSCFVVIVVVLDFY